jgi:hypothetical protein
MASFGQSQYGKFATFQNNSGSADAAAPLGGVYLFASGTAGNSKLYLQNEGQSSLIDLDSVLDIAGDSGTGTVSNSQTLTIAGGTGLDTSAADQTITFSLDLNELGAAAVDVAADSLAIVDATDNSTKKESIADLMTAAAGNGLAASSGVLAVGVDDSSIELNSDALRVKAAGITNAMLADDAVDSDELAAGAVDLAHMSANSVDSDQYVDGSIDTAHIADDQVTNAKLANITRGSVKVGGTADAPTDLDAKTSGQILVGDGTDVVSVAVSGDVSLAANGAVTIAANAVQTGMVHDDVATELAGNGLAAASGVMSLDLNELSAAAVAVGADSIAILDATDDSSKKESIADLATAMAGDGLAASSGVFAVQVGSNKGLALTSDALEITGSAVAAADVAVGTDTFMFFDADGSVKEESLADYATAIAGNGLAASSGVLAVGVDDATIELNSDALRIKDGGVDADALASSVAGNGLAGGGGTALSLDLNELSAAAVAVAADSIAIIDADDNSSKKESIADLATAMAGDGLSAGSGAFALDLNELTAAAVAVGADSIAIIDATDNGSKKESIADLATAMAGDGLAASSGVFAVGVDDSSLEINSDALRVKASGITSAMIADGAVVNADVNASAAIEATKLNFNVDLGGSIQFGTQSDDTVAFAGPIKAGANTIADSGNNAAISLDGSGGFGTLGGFGGGSGISFASSGGAQFATALTVNKSDGSMANDFKVFGDTAGAYFMYDASLDKAVMHNGTAEIMQLGTTTNGYAIEVNSALSGDAGKIKASAFVTYSDENLKEEVTAMDNALNAVMSLNGVEFTWKSTGERDFGFLAQEVKNVIPQAVSVGNDGVHGVDYSRLTSVLVEAVKAQQVQINDLKKALKK